MEIKFPAVLLETERLDIRTMADDADDSDDEAQARITGGDSWRLTFRQNAAVSQITTGIYSITGKLQPIS